jgi:RimJ/RimL family protein N-acetyltransferase
MRIRNALEVDKSYVLEFCKNTFAWGDYIADVWEGWKSKGRLYVLEEEGKVVGVYNLAISEKQAWIEGMRVHPQYRRRGLGKNMLDHAQSTAPSKTMRLIIESENYPSIRLVESMGYRLEDKWRFYTMVPRKERSTVRNVLDLSEVMTLIDSTTYADSWKWLPLEQEELHQLMKEKRIMVSVRNQKTSAIGIWNRSNDFPQTLQLGYVNGSSDGILDILRFIQNKASDLKCERIQVFAQERIRLDMSILDKRVLFYLMRKDREKSITFDTKSNS